MSLYRPKAPRRPLPSTDAACLFGRRLQRLVEAARLEDKGRFTDTEIAAYVGVSGQYIRNLRSGKSMPSVEKAQRLAEFFGVDHADYFLKPDDDPAVLATERRLRTFEGAQTTGDSAPVDEERWLHLREGHGVQQIALRAGQLSPEARSAVLGIVEDLIRSEALPDLRIDE
ncbi:helix-turn-helix domain-containing protein [Streptomyces sp. NPDC058657]|uniref:helix-turn-helix domain-containing protein n=1 Tax=unclassified Streptomyces TaxID=2593676 RepID=UPI003659AACF